MAKIVLTNICLINWYGFIYTKIPVGKDLTLITGENECGKSTILDAVKYAFTGDAEFNKSSSIHNVGGGRRTLHSYTRCLIDASAKIFARPPEKMPNVYSHISLEYYDGVNENFFVLGVVLETNASNNVSPYWYAMDHVRMDEVHYTYEENGQRKPYDYQQFQKRHGIVMMPRRDAMTKFMNMTGLKLASTEIGRFQRKLRNIMTYNPAAKIQQFIKESVLESHDINFDKLRDAKTNIDKINNTLEVIQAEVEALDGILKDFEGHERVKTRLLIDDAKQIYKEILRLRQLISREQTALEKNEAEIQHLTRLVEEREKEKNQTESEYLKAKGDLSQLDCSKAIEEEKERQRQLEQRESQLRRERERLMAFQEQVGQMLSLMDELQATVGNREILERLVTKEYSYGEKKNAADGLKKSLSRQRDELFREENEIAGSLRSVQLEIKHCDEILEECKKNRYDYSAVQEQMAFMREVNRELKSRNIQAEAKFSCEYVVKIQEEEWREAIEAFLGIHRYSILVDPKAFDVANEVLDRSAHKYVELVNTRLLAQKKVKHLEDSVVEKLVIKNEIAQKYFDFWLGGIHAVEKKDVPKYENAMSKEGKLSRNMAVTFINTKKIKTFCLGREAIELNRRMAQKRRQELEQQEREILIQQKQKKGQRVRIDQLMELFQEYQFDAASKHDEVVRRQHESAEKLERLLEAQRNNTEYQTLYLRVQDLEAELTRIRASLDRDKDRKRDLEVENKGHSEKLEQGKRNLQDKEEKMERQRAVHPSETKTAQKEYEDFLSGISKTGDLMLPESRKRRESEKQAFESSIIFGQKAYNLKKKQEEQLPEGLEYEAYYLARKNKIWVDDLQEIHAKMAEQTRKYESIFKNEFVLSLYQTALSAKDDIAGINKELRKLKFATRYQFQVNLLDDKSDYAKILRYAEYLKKTNKVDDGQMVFASLYGYEDDEVEEREKEIKEIINRIIEKNDTGTIQAFADYRNYMSYEIIINNADVKDGKLSKQAGYNSGAGTQIPYTLILSAALSMLYNARVNSTRLIFVDEPFEKMSDHNIKLMLEFFKNQDFQVIFCAPPNKMDSIGYECDTIIPVLKVSNDNMQIGSVQFHENKQSV